MIKTGLWLKVSHKSTLITPSATLEALDYRGSGL